MEESRITTCSALAATQSTSSGVPSTRIDDESVEAIERLLRRRVSASIEETQFLRSESSDGLRSRIVSGIAEGAQGVHASGRLWWAEFQIEQILSLGTESAVRERLARLPQSLEGLYEDAYEQIQTEPGPGPAVALKALMWVMCAFEPCSPDELADLVFLDVPPAQGGRLAGRALLKLCHHLLTVDRRSGVVQIAHPSVRGFLERRYAPGAGMVAAHTLVAKACLAFLGGLDTLAAVEIDLGGGYSCRYPVVFWPLHVQACLGQQEDAALSEQLVGFLGTHSKHWYRAYADLFDTYSYRISNSERTFEHRMPEASGKTQETARSLEKTLIDSLEELTFGELTPLHIAAVYGFGEPLEALWALGPVPSTINAANKHGHTMLFIASSNGSLWAVERLLEKGADASVSCAGMTARDSAAFHGRGEVVELLRGYGGAGGGGGARG